MSAFSRPPALVCPWRALRYPPFCFVIGLLALSHTALAAERRVPAGGDLQAALDAARPGDVILLEPGATYTGNFRLPVHGGTAFVTVRSAASDHVLPPAGVRISPTHSPHLPKLKSPNTAPALATAPGAAFWRLLFLEFQGNPRGFYDIVTLGEAGAEQNTRVQVPHDLVLDRVYITGHPLHGQKRAISLNSAATTISHSYIAGIRAVGQDSMAIGGWNGPGPFTIENNYLEAAGEVVLFGGADPSIADLVPSDVTLRGNTLTRPLAWREPIVATPTGVRASAQTGGMLTAGRYAYRVEARRPAYDTEAASLASAEVVVTVSEGARVRVEWTPVPDATEYRVYGRAPGAPAGYWPVSDNAFVDDGRTPPAAGKPLANATVWQVKNLLELKNARRVHISGNLLEHNWAQAQSGIAVMLTPRNQDGGCRWCVVEDVTFEHNVVRGIGGGITILGYDDEKASQQAKDIRIRHNQFSDLGPAWGGNGYFMYLLAGPRNVVVDHNTIISTDGAGIVNIDGPPVHGFVFTNNIARHNRYGFIGPAAPLGIEAIRHYFPDGVVTNNVIAAPDGHRYPAGNKHPAIAEFEAQFVNYRAGDFRVKPGSSWERAGSNGLPIGATLRQ